MGKRPVRGTGSTPARSEKRDAPRDRGENTRPTNSLLEVQAAVGNAATIHLMRQVATKPPPAQATAVPDMYSMTADLYRFGAPEPSHDLPPAVVEQLLAVRATLSKVPPLDARHRAILHKALPGAPVLELIKRRDTLRSWLQNVPAQISVLSPTAGQPDEANAYQIHSLQQTSETYRAELEEVQGKIDALVRQTGAASEAQLADLVENQFPKTFVERGKQIAIQQLMANLKIVETEAARFGVDRRPRVRPPGSLTKSDKPSPYQPGTPDPAAAVGLRAAAKELIGYRDRRKAVEDANVPRAMTMEDEYNEIQAGNPDPGGRMAIQAAVTAERRRWTGWPCSSRSSIGSTSTPSSRLRTRTSRRTSTPSPRSSSTTSGRPRRTSRTAT